MKKFEYSSRLISYNTNYELIQKLNEYGKEGWEFVSFDDYATFKSLTGLNRSVIFKKEIQ